MIEVKKKQYFEATGYSMWPFLRQQDRIIVEQNGCADLRPGNVVVYESDGKPLCHRLVRKIISAGKYLLFTRGDYVQSWRTEKVEEEQVVGRVSAIIRGSKIISLRGKWQTVGGRIIVLVFPLVAWFVAALQKIVRKQ